MKYVIVCEEEEEPTIELPLEEDGTLLLSTLTCQFPKATGLKYKSKDTGIYRGVRFASDRFYPPPEGWETYTYSCVLFKGIFRFSRSLCNWNKLTNLLR